MGLGVREGHHCGVAVSARRVPPAPPASSLISGLSPPVLPPWPLRNFPESLACASTLVLPTPAPLLPSSLSPRSGGALAANTSPLQLVIALTGPGCATAGDSPLPATLLRFGPPCSNGDCFVTAWAASHCPIWLLGRAEASKRERVWLRPKIVRLGCFGSTSSQEGTDGLGATVQCIAAQDMAGCQHVTVRTLTKRHGDAQDAPRRSGGHHHVQP